MEIIDKTLLIKYKRKNKGNQILVKNINKLILESNLAEIQVQKEYDFYT